MVFKHAPVPSQSMFDAFGLDSRPPSVKLAVHAGFMALQQSLTFFTEPWPPSSWPWPSQEKLRCVQDAKTYASSAPHFSEASTATGRRNLSYDEGSLANTSYVNI